MKHSLILSAILVLSCGAPNTSSRHGTVSSPHLDACQAACARLEVLGCEEAQEDAEGTTCLEMCVHTQDAGLIDLEPEKMAEQDHCP